mgnify:CR=1 FL=1
MKFNNKKTLALAGAICGIVGVLLAKTGNISERDMFNTFNMGVGMSIVVPADEVEAAIEILKANGEDAYVIGEIIVSDEKIIIE